MLMAGGKCRLCLLLDHSISAHIYFPCARVEQRVISSSDVLPYRGWGCSRFLFLSSWSRVTVFAKLSLGLCIFSMFSPFDFVSNVKSYPWRKTGHNLPLLHLCTRDLLVILVQVEATFYGKFATDIECIYSDHDRILGNCIRLKASEWGFDISIGAALTCRAIHLFTTKNKLWGCLLTVSWGCQWYTKLSPLDACWSRKGWV